MRRAKLIPRWLLLASALLAGSAMAEVAPNHCELEQAGDPQLQQSLESLVDELGLTEATERGDLALSLLVLTDDEHPRLAQINGNDMLYAASLPKIAILLGAAVGMDEGWLKPDRSLRQDIQDMIRYSCNDCANRVLEAVGGERLLDVLQSPKYGFYNAEEGGGLWLGKPYNKHPAFHRDPLKGLSHAATTYQVARFYCRLHESELVSPRQDRMMLEALSRPGINHKFVKGLAGESGLQLFRKSGTWRTFHADSALVRRGDEAYVLVALSRDHDGSEWLEQLAEPINALALRQPVQRRKPVTHAAGGGGVAFHE
ncbi:serine hydrolase [Parahaliea maris]|uniref:beta-lactamase n=1 Tax=Parahaliea maris TaxID=2716870 RepID=A0A5C9A7Y8_9GAMM|nr:serine hydrolase [Parahaliea maris]TXS96239.1 serine hydrolase [Parahaliea maris]